jgi:hypothetical protein
LVSDFSGVVSLHFCFFLTNSYISVLIPLCTCHSGCQLSYHVASYRKFLLRWSLILEIYGWSDSRIRGHIWGQERSPCMRTVWFIVGDFLCIFLQDVTLLDSCIIDFTISKKKSRPVNYGELCEHRRSLTGTY